MLIEILSDVIFSLPYAILFGITVVISMLPAFAFEYVLDQTSLKKITKNIMFILLVIGIAIININYIYPITCSLVSKIFAS